jgi:hypothetical protein
VAPQVEVLEHHGQARAHALQLGRVGDAHAAAAGDQADVSPSRLMRHRWVVRGS